MRVQFEGINRVVKRGDIIRYSSDFCLVTELMETYLMDGEDTQENPYPILVVRFSDGKIMETFESYEQLYDCCEILAESESTLLTVSRLNYDCP